MRILMTTRGSAGHLIPMAPFGHAWKRAGHEVLVAAQAQHKANVERVGLPFAPVRDPPASEWVPLMQRMPEMGVDAANDLMVGEFFAGIDCRAALPALRTLAERWKPTVIVRESWEFASTLVGEQREIPVVRVGLGLAAAEERSRGLAAPVLDRARAALDLPTDPTGDRLRDSPYFTMVPEPLEDPAAALPARTHRFGQPAAAAAAPIEFSWPGSGDPLVYLTFGSVTAGPHLPYFPRLYRAAIDALSSLPARILVTIGTERDAGELGPLPANVRVEPWVAQEAVAPHVAAIVCHGGYGTTLGALAHGVPLVVLPLFSLDQWMNADAVARAGAGVALVAGRRRRRSIDLPGDEEIRSLEAAVRRVLDDPAHRQGARRIAEAMRAMPPVESSAFTLAEISRMGS